MTVCIVDIVDLSDFSNKKKNLQEKCIVSKELTGKMDSTISQWNVTAE